jgi:hypothetical protein
MSDASPRAKACCLLALVALACGHRDGIVGTQPLAVAGTGGDAVMAGGGGAGGNAVGGTEPGGDAGASGDASAGVATGGTGLLGFSEEFVVNGDGIWSEIPKLPMARTDFGVNEPLARDGELAELVFPGHPEYGPAEKAGTAFATELSTQQRFHYGVFRTRLGFGSCASSEETVQAFLGYFADGRDNDKDGIVDELVVSMQVLCGAPNRAYLTVFTDYQETPTLRFRKLSRVIDFSTGNYSETPRSDADGYGPEQNDPALMLPGLFAPGTMYELGFEWHADSLRFFAVQAGAERDLWTLGDAAQIPQEPLHIVYHAWHPPTHWYPQDSSAQFPASDVVMRIDWVSYEPE